LIFVSENNNNQEGGSLMAMFDKKKDEPVGVPAVVGSKEGGLPVANSTDLAEYAFVNDHALDIVRENLGGQQMTAGDFERIKFPSGGQQSWEISGLSGEVESVKTIDGIVLMHKTSRVFWQEDFTGAGSPPDCQSKDLVTGQGTPGGLCATCPNAQWESDPKGSGGQACKTVGTLFVMKPGELLPVIVPVPVASVAPLKKFMLGLSSKNIKYSNAILSIGLKPDQNKKGIKYSKLNPKLISILPIEAKSQIDSYIAQFRGAMNAVSVTHEDAS
jgi:hypothetical protein